MNPSNEDPKPTDNAELLKQQAPAGGPGCGCHAAANPAKTRWTIGLLVLAAAGVMVARAITRNGGTQPLAASPGFAVPALAASDANSSSASQGTETSVGTMLGAFSELNSVATKTDAVLLFVPGKENSDSVPAAPMRAAARTIETQGLKCGLFTLKAGTPDYDAIARQVAVPAVLAMVRGRGMVPVSGDVTETKPVQGFVAASRAGSCAGGSCGPGCGQ